MNVFRHDYVSDDSEPIPIAHLFDDSEQQIPSLGGAQQRQAITTASASLRPGEWAWLQILWLQSSFLGDAGQHHRADFIVVVEGPRVMSVIRMSQFFMRADLTEERPTDFEKCFVYNASLSAGPLAHAIWRSRLIEFGGASCECSTSSATERSAMAYALLIASSFVLP